MVIVRWAKVGGAAATLLVTTVVPMASAVAQIASDDRPARTSTTISPITGRGFRIGASMETYYDSNVLRLGKGFTPSGGRSKGDFRFTPSVEAAVGQPVGRQQLFIGAEIGRDFYARYNERDRNRYSIGGGAILKAGSACNGSITGDYRRRQALLSESSVSRDNTQQTLDYGAVFDCAPSTGIGFGGGVVRQETKNDNPNRQVQDSRETNYDAHLNFGASAIGTFSAGGTLSKFYYPKRSLFVSNPGGGLPLSVNDKLDLYSARLGFSRALGTALSVNTSVSYIKVKPKPDTVLNFVQDDNGNTFLVTTPRAGYSGPGYNAVIDYHPSGRFGAQLSGGRNVTSSPNVAARLDVRDDIGLTLNYQIGTSISTSVGGDYNRRRFKGGFATIEEPFARISDKTTRLFARVTYAPRPLYAVDFEVGHQVRSSNPSLYDVTSNSASITLRVKFGRG